jgi:hypothetical protein
LETDQPFTAEFAIFSTIDLRMLWPGEACHLCHENPPMLKYRIGSGSIREGGTVCLTCAGQILGDMTTVEIGHWLAQRG